MASQWRLNLTLGRARRVLSLDRLEYAQLDPLHDHTQGTFMACLKKQLVSIPWTLLSSVCSPFPYMSLLSTLDCSFGFIHSSALRPQRMA